MIKIKDVEIENFRSVTEDTGKILLDDFTVIVGQNNSGKSNILRALNLFYNGKTDAGPFDPLVDFSMNSKLGPNSKTKVTVTMTYSPSVDVRIHKEVESIAKNQGIKPYDTNTIRLRQTYSRRGTEQWQYIGSVGIRQIKDEVIRMLVTAKFPATGATQFPGWDPPDFLNGSQSIS